MVRVVSIDRSQPVGVTHPCVARMDNGDLFTAFIKLKDNPEGPRCLVNELVSYRLAKGLGVLMPESGVAMVDEEGTVDNSGEGILKKTSYGMCFYSSQIANAVTLRSSIMRFVDNKHMYERIVLFDHLVYNTDRNIGNLLVKSSRKHEKLLYAIDHTHVFKNQALWDACCLERGISEDDFLSEDIIESNESVYNCFAQDRSITASSLLAVASDFKAVFNEEFVDDALKDIPEEWMLGDADLVALKKYLLYRVDHLDDMCKMIVRKEGWKND